MHSKRTEWRHASHPMGIRFSRAFQKRTGYENSNQYLQVKKISAKNEIQSIGRGRTSQFDPIIAAQSIVFFRIISTQSESGYTFSVSGFFCFSIESCPTFFTSANGNGSFLLVALFCVTGCASRHHSSDSARMKKSSDIQVGTRYVSSLSQMQLKYIQYQTCRGIYIGVGIVDVAGVLRFAANVALCARDCNVNSFSTIIIKSFDWW